MKKLFKKKILTKLLEKYERSSLFKDNTKSNGKITMHYNEKDLVEYVNEDSYLYEKTIEEVTEELEKKDYIKVFLEKNGRVQKISLNLDKLEEIYQEIERENPKQKRNNFSKILENYPKNSALLEDVCNYLKNEIMAFHSIDIYAKDEEELKNLLYLIEKISNQQEEISRRVFSTKYLNDSKKLEQIANKIETLIKKSSTVLEDNVLEQFNIVKNPSIIYIKGCGCFQINEQEINLSHLKSVFILSFEHIKNLKFTKLDLDKVTTIENLTTFYNYPQQDKELVIYLGGYHNHLKSCFLKMLYHFTKTPSFIHIGDIDAGGFYILNHLIEDTEIPFESKYMDISTLKKYEEYTKELTLEDRNRLEKLLDKELGKKYEQVILYMLEKNQKLEQEAIEFKVG